MSGTLGCNDSVEAELDKYTFSPEINRIYNHILRDRMTVILEKLGTRQYIAYLAIPANNYGYLPTPIILGVLTKNT